jgi:hypothetical protein
MCLVEALVSFVYSRLGSLLRHYDGSKWFSFPATMHGGAEANKIKNDSVSVRTSGHTSVHVWTPRLHFVSRAPCGPAPFERHQHREEGRGRRPHVSLVQKDPRCALATTSYRMPSRRREEKTTRRGSRRREGRCNTQFETSRCNTWNKHLNTDETLETCI